jgi:hypothetical protein
MFEIEFSFKSNPDLSKLAIVWAANAKEAKQKLVANYKGVNITINSVATYFIPNGILFIR